jgi:hypothetical protein
VVKNEDINLKVEISIFDEKYKELVLKDQTKEAAFLNLCKEKCRIKK